MVILPSTVSLQVADKVSSVSLGVGINHAGELSHKAISKTIGAVLSI